MEKGRFWFKMTFCCVLQHFCVFWFSGYITPSCFSISSPTHTDTHTHQHQHGSEHGSSSAHQHINTSKHQHIYISPHQLMNTSVRLASDAGQWCCPVVFIVLASDAGQWCCPVVLSSLLANLASLLRNVHTHDRTCSNVI